MAARLHFLAVHAGMHASPQMPQQRCKDKVHMPRKGDEAWSVDLDKSPVQHHSCTASPLSHSMEDFLQVHLVAVYLHRMAVPSSTLSHMNSVCCVVIWREDTGEQVARQIQMLFVRGI